MPHIVVKMFPGRTQQQKQDLADALTQAMIATLQAPADAISVAIEDIEKRDWMDQVAKPEIAGKAATIFKKPGYEIP
ncbi:MAG: tautomerase family protein [Rhodospirillaceae bacterium]